MKLSSVIVLALPALATAFVSTPRVVFGTSLASSPAKSADEDLELTRKVILDFITDGDDEEKAPAPKAEKEE